MFRDVTYPPVNPSGGYIICETYDHFIEPTAHSTRMHKGRMGQIKQKGSLMLLTMPDSAPCGPPGIVPGIS